MFLESQPIRIKSIIIVSFQLRLGLPKDLFPSGFPTKTVCISELFHTCYMSCPSQSSRFKIPNYVTLNIQCTYSALCNFHHSPVISSFLAPNIFLSTLFSNTLNLCSSLKVRDKFHNHTIQPVV